MWDRKTPVWLFQSINGLGDLIAGMVFIFLVFTSTQKIPLKPFHPFRPPPSLVRLISGMELPDLHKDLAAFLEFPW